MGALLSEIKVARRTLKEEGIRAVFKKYGWKLVVVVVAYYLVRDITLYILIPMFIFKSVS